MQVSNRSRGASPDVLRSERKRRLSRPGSSRVHCCYRSSIGRERGPTALGDHTSVGEESRPADHCYPRAENPRPPLPLAVAMRGGGRRRSDLGSATGLVMAGAPPGVPSRPPRPFLLQPSLPGWQSESWPGPFSKGVGAPSFNALHPIQIPQSTPLLST